MEQGAVQVRGMLILPLLFCLGACAHVQPIRLNPVSTLVQSPHRPTARAAQPSYAAAASSCVGPSSRRLTRARKDELFRQFAAQDSPPEGQPDSAPMPAKARTPACRTAGR